MPEREWDVLLNEYGDRVYIRLVVELGTVVDYAIRYVIVIDGKPRQVVLCDGSHEEGHCHELGWDGRKLNRILAEDPADLNAAATAAIDDLQRNWERHRDAFLRRRP